jgi:putative nucleotidyltransferase with HDIG domain
VSVRVEHLPRYEEIAQRLSAAVRAARLYSIAHQSVSEHMRGLLAAVQHLHEVQPTILIGFVGGEIIADDTPLARASTARVELTRHLQALGVHRLLLERGVTVDEIRAFVRAVAETTPAARSGGGEGDAPAEETAEIDFIALPHLRAGRIPIDAESGQWGTNVAGVRRVYAGSLTAARVVWESAQVEGRPDLHAASDTVDQLAEAVGAARPVMLGLTGMKEHDEYTFTHMVNVSILTIAQARTLGLEGAQLRALGLAALLHDIGKVRTPPEILNKPGALTDREMAIMKRHTIDGAVILRRTREMPRLAPIVALEHHLRLDGTGYPERLRRPTLNVATMLCGIADVYDAMRSQRAYQQAFPTDRIIAVMRRNDGRQFDQHLVRRFIGLMGIYPPGTLVRLDSGEVAVVVQSDGPDPQRPTVQLLFDRTGARLPQPRRRVRGRSGQPARRGVAPPRLGNLHRSRASGRRIPQRCRPVRSVAGRTGSSDAAPPTGSARPRPDSST